MVNRFISILLVLILISCGGSAENIKIGDSAPDFSLQDHNGKTYQLSSYKGKSPVILYFYPKANTPGCTTQACGIRDEFSQFTENNIAVLGVSVDSKDALKEFIDEHSLNFPLLSDENKSVSEIYGVLNNIGFSNRITFIIDKEGKISEIIRDVDVKTHANEVLEKAKKLI